MALKQSHEECSCMGLLGEGRRRGRRGRGRERKYPRVQAPGNSRNRGPDKESPAPFGRPGQGTVARRVGARFPSPPHLWSLPSMRLTLTRPDDWHLHLRDGEAMRAVLPDSARRFGRAIVMPNLKPPVTTVAAARDYRQRILAALPAGALFEPLMTLYMT